MVPSSTPLPDRGSRRRVALPVAVWTFVLALLFAAVAPLGEPDTLAHGPAFNPATTSVAIAAKRSDQATGLWQSVRGVRHDGAGSGGAMLALAPALASVLVLLVLSYACTPAKLLRPVRCGARGARSPPARRC
jgi:hypothetical protein